METVINEGGGGRRRWVEVLLKKEAPISPPTLSGLEGPPTVLFKWKHLVPVTRTQLCSVCSCLHHRVTSVLQIILICTAL